MLALACAGNPAFVPSRIEEDDSGEPNYSVATVRRMASRLSAADKLFLIVGVDAFLGIAKWREPVELLDACDFIVVSRPGFAMENVAAAIPEDLRPSVASTGGTMRIALRRTLLHLLTSVQVPVSASEIRRRAARNEPLCGLVPDSVAEYIQKTRVYADQES
jgi:nicotinate-nucleotide adenylyltransferase